jgi:hypothetical protein
MLDVVLDVVERDVVVLTSAQLALVLSHPLEPKNGSSELTSLNCSTIRWSSVRLLSVSSEGFSDAREQHIKSAQTRV